MGLGAIADYGIAKIFALAGLDDVVQDCHVLKQIVNSPLTLGTW